MLSKWIMMFVFVFYDFEMDSGVVFAVDDKRTTVINTETEVPRPTTAGECAFKGDPHIFQFDANKSMFNASILFKRTCSYILVQTNCSIPYCRPNFFVTGSFKYDKPTSIASSIHEIDAMIDLGKGHAWGVRLTKKLRRLQVFKVGSKNPIQVIGNAKKLKKRKYFHKGNTIVVKPGSQMNDGDWDPTKLIVVVTFKNKAQVMYDGAKMAKIFVPPVMSGNVCGVCGNFDGDATNDRRIGYLYEGSLWRKGQCDGLRPKGPFSRLSQNSEKFVTSWYWGGSTTGTCRDECEIGRRNKIPNKVQCRAEPGREIPKECKT